MTHARRSRRDLLALARLAALAALTLLYALAGCSQPVSRTETGAHPEAVLVQFYDGAKFVRACSGSLIASKVVLTAAHCADKTTAAVVVAPAANGQRSTTAGVYTYDWTPDDPKMNPAMRNDVALLALRSPISISRYAAIQKTPCASCSVVHVGRGLDARGSFVVESKALRVAANAPPQRPLAQLVATPPAVADGGAFYRASSTGQPLIVGVMTGKGAQSGGSYIAPLSDPVVQLWVRAIVKRVQPSASSATKTKSIHVLDDPPSDNGDPSNGGDPVVPPPDNNGDTSSSSSSTSSSGSSGSADPAADPPDPPSADEPVTPTTTDGNSGASSSSSSSSGSDGAPDPNAAQRDPGTDTPSNETPDANNTYEDGTAPGGTHNWPGSIPGVAPLKIVGNGDEVVTVQPTGNAVTVASPDDDAFTDDPAQAAKMQGIANIYGSHGMPGTLVGEVPDDQVRAFMQDDKPLVVTSCFGGATTSGGSAIRRMVNEYGTEDNASRTYGCTGYASSTFSCTGTWVDANGHAVPADEQQRLGMTQQQCSVNSLRRKADGSVETYWDQCVNGSPGSE